MLFKQIINLYDLEPVQLFHYINDKIYNELTNRFVLVKSLYKSLKNEEIVEIDFPNLVFEKLQSNFEHLQRIENQIVFNEDTWNRTNVPTHMLLVKHKQLKENLQKIRELTNNYDTSKSKSTFYKILVNELHEIEDDLLEILTIKENILFKEPIDKI